MKKIFPTLALGFIFGVLIIFQMLMHGQKTGAENLSDNSSKFSSFESEFTKLKHSTTRGTEVDFKHIKEPVVIINFWASWCKPCISEFRSLKELIENTAEGLKVIGINNDTEEQMKSIIKVENKLKLPFESIADIDGDIAEKFNITRLPATIIYHKGRVIYFSNKETDFMSKEMQSLISTKVTEE